MGANPKLREELREHMRARLPDYMIPWAIRVLAKLPLSANGKVDRDALPQPGKDDALAQSPYIAPGTTLEQTLVAIWEELLDCNQIGVHDNFFDLGGHSLLITRLQSRLRDMYGIEFPMRDPVRVNDDLETGAPRRNLEGPWWRRRGA